MGHFSFFSFRETTIKGSRDRFETNCGNCQKLKDLKWTKEQKIIQNKNPKFSELLDHVLSSLAYFLTCAGTNLDEEKAYSRVNLSFFPLKQPLIKGHRDTFENNCGNCHQLKDLKWRKKQKSPDLEDHVIKFCISFFFSC